MPDLATGPADLRDLFVEVVNAKDPDMFSLADDIEIPEEVIEGALTVMERWPRLMLGRAEIGSEPVAAIWVPDEDDRYTTVGYLIFDVVDGVARVDVVESRDPELTTESPAGIELAEWETSEAVGEGWTH